MKTNIVCLSLVWFCASLALGGEPTGRITFRNAGFSIAPLDEPARGTVQVLVMCLAASDGFAPNVNVQVQPYADTLDAYAALSRTQFKDAGMKILSETKPTPASISFEYTGTFQGKALHWYARVLKKNQVVYLTTATCTETQWTTVAAKLKACVDSLEVL